MWPSPVLSHSFNSFHGLHVMASLSLRILGFSYFLFSLFFCSTVAGPLFYMFYSETMNRGTEGQEGVPLMAVDILHFIFILPELVLFKVFLFM